MNDQIDYSFIINEVIKKLNITPYEMANRLGYKSPATIYHVKDGRNKISESLAERIVQAYPAVNYNFLITGEGSVLLNSDTEKKNQMNLLNMISAEDLPEVELIRKFINIPNQIKIIEDRMDSLEGKLDDIFRILGEK